MEENWSRETSEEGQVTPVKYENGADWVEAYGDNSWWYLLNGTEVELTVLGKLADVYLD